MRARDIEDALDEARHELDRALHHRSRLELDKEAFDVKLSKLRVALRTGQQNLRTLRESPIVLLSEYENIQNLTGSIKVEIVNVHAQMATNFELMANNRVEISQLEKIIHNLVETLSKTDNNILEFPSDVRRST